MENHRDRAGWPKLRGSLAGNPGLVWRGWIFIARVRAIRAVQVGGGSEFAVEFEQACQHRGLHLFVLPPRSPKLNGAVERAKRTHTEEFYQVTHCSLEMNKLNHELRHWEKIYNTVRSYQSLGPLPPLQFLRQISSQRKE